MNAKNIYRGILFICFSIAMAFLLVFVSNIFPEWEWYKGRQGWLVGVVLLLFSEFLGEILFEKYQNEIEKRFSLDDFKTITIILIGFIILIILSIPVLILLNT